MSRHDPLVTLRQLLDFVVEAKTISEGRARSDLGKDRMFTLAMERLLTLKGKKWGRVFHFTHIGYGFAILESLGIYCVFLLAR